MKFLLAILLLATLAAAQQPASPTPADRPKLETRPNLPSEETVNSFIQQMFGFNTGLSWKVADIRPSEAEGLAEVVVVVSTAQGQQSMHFYVTADGTHALTGEIMPFGAHPFAETRGVLQKGVNGPAHGATAAPVTLVEFSDLQCPHCKEAQPSLDKLMSEEPKVRLVFQNFPLPVHDWANKGAAFADCIGRRSADAFWKFIHDVYEAQTTITAATADEKLTAIADNSGVGGSEIAACATQPETVARVEHSVALGKELKITGTPTLFVNGRRIENFSAVPYDTLKQLVEFAAKDGQSQPEPAK